MTALRTLASFASDTCHFFSISPTVLVVKKKIEAYYTDLDIDYHGND